MLESALNKALFSKNTKPSRGDLANGVKVKKPARQPRGAGCLGTLPKVSLPETPAQALLLKTTKLHNDKLRCDPAEDAVSENRACQPREAEEAGDPSTGPSHRKPTQAPLAQAPLLKTTKLHDDMLRCDLAEDAVSENPACQPRGAEEAGDPS